MAQQNTVEETQDPDFETMKKVKSSIICLFIYTKLA